jgi:hypothetical protein
MIETLVLTAAVGVAGWLGYDELKKRMKIPDALKPGVPPILNQPGNPRIDPSPPPAPPPEPKQVGTTPAGNPIIVITPINPDTKLATVTNQVATESPAAPAAHALYDYLKAHGTKKNDELTNLVTQFQAAHNTSEMAKKTTGIAIPVNGNYDVMTAGALTVYIGTPIPADPAVPVPPEMSNPLAPGPAANAGSNLYAYLKTHKDFKKTKDDPTQKALILAFQKAVNTDPKFPGPKFSIPQMIIIKEKLAEDGYYGKKTSDALAVTAYERIEP